jgi:hypothetical protein
MAKNNITLKELDNLAIVASDGQPATLYQIAWWVFHKRSVEALKTAREGDFAQVNALMAEVKTIIDEFVQHGLFLNGELARIKRWQRTITYNVEGYNLEFVISSDENGIARIGMASEK